MAPVATQPISDDREVEEHYLAQFAIVAAMSKAIKESLTPELDPVDLPGTFPIVRRGIVALVDEYSRASISIAADHYEDLRARQIPGRFVAPTIEPTPQGQVLTTLDRIADKAFDRAKASPDELFLAEIADQLARGAGISAESLVAEAASDEIFTAMSEDDRARGWARITRPGACYFCRLLASRGAVYYTERSGSFRAHAPKDGRGGTCRCAVEPVFGAQYEPTAQARADAETYARVSADVDGHAKVEEFRRAVEGREDGPRRRRTRSGKGQPPVKVGNRSAGWGGFEAMTPAELQHQLTFIEPLRDSDYRTRQIERLRNRLAELGS